MELIGRYMNGNILTTLLSDGTLIRETQDDEFRPAFASNMDIKICNRCDRGCPWCHEGSTPNGELADIMNEPFVNTLHPYQEVALGGGNVLEHPDLVPFLYKLKGRKVIANATLNQKHFEENLSFVRSLVSQNLICGLGISLENPTDEFLAAVREFPNAVIHVINGVVTPDDIIQMVGKNIKLLVLGYKTLRRGKNWIDKDADGIAKRQEWLKTNLPLLVDKFAVLSFDNLAIEQLGVKEKWTLLSHYPWDEFYAGDDGSHTYYIDMVKREFALSSTAPLNERYPLMNNVDYMFKFIQSARESKLNEDSKRAMGNHAE